MTVHREKGAPIGPLGVFPGIEIVEVQPGLLDLDAASRAVFDGITDIHINATRIEDSVVFPGPKAASLAVLQAARVMVKACADLDKPDFMIKDQGICWRGRRDMLTVDGIWYRLRRMPEHAPRLENLPSKLSPALLKLLLMPGLSKGGLIYICGAPGSGKTTLASGTVVSRLVAYGGYAYTVEDPPEMPINGWHEEGYCAQAWVPGNGIADWMEAMRGALRSQPSSTPCMLYVGEVRDADSARTLLRAASNGFLVVATGFANDIPSGLNALLHLAGEDMAQILAASLRLCIYTKIVSGVLAAGILASSNASSPVALRITSGRMNLLAGDIEQQANQLRSGSSFMPFG